MPSTLTTPGSLLPLTCTLATGFPSRLTSHSPTITTCAPLTTSTMHTLTAATPLTLSVPAPLTQLSTFTAYSNPRPYAINVPKLPVEIAEEEEHRRMELRVRGFQERMQLKQHQQDRAKLYLQQDRECVAPVRMTEENARQDSGGVSVDNDERKAREP
eukprot:GEMP01067872.1.p1 GENE.GEMP01067872.1~~GEMP01067872.1.p1  ORF type:complete len:158 (+),score=40.76 GEMP01067872.1:173-646(+)